jgi:hypothetical protein
MKASQDFNKKIYDFEILKKSLKDFSKICRGKIEKRKEYFHVVLESKIKTENIQRILLEFRNYVLGVMKNRIIV